MNRTLQRLERILVMVPWLLEHPGVAVEEVCERFGVTREELATDLDVLGYCGLPGYGGGDLVETSMYGDRVTVRMAHFFSRPLALSVREALTLLLAARALASVEGLAESRALRRAADKLETLLGAQGARLAVDLAAPGDEHLPVARQAVADRRVVHLVYRSASKAETTERDVEPWAVVGHGGAWYLQGWCRLARGPRAFRLDRVRALRLTAEQVAADARGTPAPPVYEPSSDDVPVVVDLDPAAWWVLDQVVADEVEETGGLRRVRLRTPAPEWVARLVLRLGGRARVVAPPALAARVAQLAQQTLARYEAAASADRPGGRG